MGSVLDYKTGNAAALRVLQAELAQLPFWDRNAIHPDQVLSLANALSRAVIDSVDAERAAAAKLKPVPAPAPAPKAVPDHSPTGVAKKAWGWLRGKI